MRLSGFFHIEFSASGPGKSATVIVDGPTVRGWNDEYFFSGSWVQLGSEFLLRLRVKASSNSAHSIFGTVGTEYNLELRGTAAVRTFQFSGPSPIPGGKPLIVTGTKVANLDLR